MFKLAKSWKALSDILTILSNTFGALANLSFVLFIIIFIFAVMGMQLFGSKYVENVCNDKWLCEMPRWNFTDFFHRYGNKNIDKSYAECLKAFFSVA